MSALGRRGVEIEVPRGWDGGIHLRVAAGAPAAGVPGAPGTSGASGASGGDVLAPAQADGSEEALVTLHAATFPLPPVRGDYGSGAVETMGPGDVFVSLLEFGASSLGSALFVNEGLSLPLDPESFSPQQLQRPQRGQGGLQLFFTQSGRTFCAYVVIGSWGDRHELVPLASELLAGLRIDAG